MCCCWRQVAVNRSRLKAVVEALLRDMPHQREAAARREEGIEFARQFHNVGSPPSTPCAEHFLHLAQSQCSFLASIRR